MVFASLKMTLDLNYLRTFFFFLNEIQLVADESSLGLPALSDDTLSSCLFCLT